MSKTTPMMKQYWEIRKQYPDSILMFRMGDFYEMFFEDAETASRILGIALTARNKSSENPVPLCGVPFHSVEGYITRLLEHGLKVAICDQVEDPKLAKGLVRRKVTRVLTPGAVLDTEKLDAKTSNYVAALWSGPDGAAIAYADMSTGEFATTTLGSVTDALEELARHEPRELLVPRELAEDRGLRDSLASRWSPLVTVFDTWSWEYTVARQELLGHFKTLNLEPFGLEGSTEAVIACGAVIVYLEGTQMEDMPAFENLVHYDTASFLVVDGFTKDNLELHRTLRGAERKNTLLWVLDQTATPMGGRMLKQWLAFPLRDPGKINTRLDATEELMLSPSSLSALRKVLGEIHDLERLIGRICTTYARPADLASLRDSCFIIGSLKETVARYDASLLEVIEYGIHDLGDIAELLEGAITDAPPAHLRDGGVIKEGYNPELDELRTIRSDVKKWLSQVEADEREKTGIASLKVGFNRVFGYYIEVSKTNLYNVPDHYVRKQTLVGAERFITEEIKVLEEKIVGAETRMVELEAELFEQIRLGVAAEASRIRSTAASIAVLDVLAGFAEVALRYDYSRPEVSSKGGIELRASRHPVIERMQLDERFVPNDVKLDHAENQLLVITGPNMAGKSTIMRQVALNVIMAQMGCFVAAGEAGIGVVDKIFTRVGASDDLARGQSTFMVEMVETAYILRNATERSLVIFDEIGRGTSTFDGISLAWAVAEYVHRLGVLTMFATHYHQLAELAVSHKKVQNYNVYVKEDGGNIVFLRKLVPGSTSHSYGIQVARLAGVPDGVIKTARGVLARLEKAQAGLGTALGGGQTDLFAGEGADDGGDEEERTACELLSALGELDPMRMSPLEALNKLVELKKIADGTDGGE